jgi:hypothetical protein
VKTALNSDLNRLPSYAEVQSTLFSLLSNVLQHSSLNVTQVRKLFN